MWNSGTCCKNNTIYHYFFPTYHNLTYSISLNLSTRENHIPFSSTFQLISWKLGSRRVNFPPRHNKSQLYKISLKFNLMGEIFACVSVLNIHPGRYDTGEYLWRSCSMSPHIHICALWLNNGDGYRFHVIMIM